MRELMACDCDWDATPAASIRVAQEEAAQRRRSRRSGMVVTSWRVVANALVFLIVLCLQRFVRR
jgi:hypothetical protein